MQQISLETDNETLEVLSSFKQYGISRPLAVRLLVKKYGSQLLQSISAKKA